MQLNGSVGMVQRLSEYLPGIKERAVETEALGRLPDATVKDLKDAQFTRLLQPAKHGGFESHPREFFESVYELASACGATGWVMGILGVHPWEIGLFDQQAQNEVWGDDPDTWIASTYMPVGRLTPDGKNYKLSGRWTFSSGIDHCEWVILGCLYQEHKDAALEVRHALLPANDYAVENIWNVVGLRGTGSNAVVVEDVTVPHHRVVTQDMISGGQGPGVTAESSLLYQLPFGPMFGYAITASILGMVNAGLKEAAAATRTRVSKNYGNAVADPYLVSALGAAQGDLAACRLQMLTHMDTLYSVLSSGKTLSVEQRSDLRRDQVLSTERAILALDTVFAKSGASAIEMDNPLQRIWRDVHAARHHMANNLGPTMFSAGQVMMGFEPTDILF